MSNLMQESEFSSMQKQATITDLFQNMKGKPMRNVGEHQSALVLSKVEPRTSTVTISPRKNERSPRKSIQDFLSSQRSKQNSTTRTDSNVTVEHIDSCDDTDFPDTVKEYSKFMCPVCAREITCENLGGLNNHIDICLEQNSSQNNTQGHSQRHVDHSGQSGDNDKRTREADYETSPTKVLTCPICDKQQPTQDLHQFNLHVDSCLNKDTVRQLVDQQDRELSDTRKRYSIFVFTSQQSRDFEYVFFNAEPASQTAVQH